PIILFAPSIIGVIPLLAAVTNNHGLFAVANLPTGIFYVLAVSSIPVVGIVMGGWASNNKYSLVGGLRSAAQAISYEIPLVLAIITICMMAGTLDVVKIANRQAVVAVGEQAVPAGLLGWNIFGGGALVQAVSALQSGAAHAVFSLVAAVLLACCTALLFLIYITGACAEVNRIPFDLPEAESELV